MRLHPQYRAAVFTALLTVCSLGGFTIELSAQVQTTTLNYVNARLSDVIRSLATSLGINVLLTDVPERRITFQTSVPVRTDQLGSVLESILEANNLVLVQQGPLAQVFPADSVPPTGLIRFGLELTVPPPVGLVTQMVPLQSIRADEAAAALKQIATARARIEPVPRSNSLLITDLGSNVARYLELLRRLDERPQGDAGLRTFVVPLKYANAEDLAGSLGQLFGIGVAGSRSMSLSDLSLSRNLDVFRERTNEMYRLRPDLPTTLPQLVVPGDTGQLGALVGRTTIVADLPTNSLMIRTAPPNFPLLRETIDALDTKPPQVLFEVTVAEVVLGRAEEFGIDWAVAVGNTGINVGNPNAAQPDTISRLRDFVIRVFSLNDDVDVRAVLRAVSSKSNVRVLSTPEILAVNNREARIVVGDRVPFVSSARLGDIAIDRSVQYEDVGTTLTIIPTINSDDYVSVQILQEVNRLTNQVIRSALDAPVISTREASTRAIIRDGQTVVIGGLIGDSREYFDSGIPFLKDIPILGNLFKFRTDARNRTELAIFVTPHIVRSDEDANMIRQRIRDRMNRLMPDTLPAIRR